MTDIDKLVHTIRTNPPEGPDHRPVWWVEAWIKALEQAADSWEQVIEGAFDGPDWQRIESARPFRGYDSLCDVLLNVLGLPLAVRWLFGRDSGRRERAWTWLDGMPLTAADWATMQPDLRRAMIIHSFESGPARLLLDRHQLARELALEGHRPRPLPPIVSHLKPPRIALIESLAKQVGDAASLELISDLQPYESEEMEPSDGERELLARVLTLTRRAGFRLAGLPPISLSWATPPLFLAYPEIEPLPTQREPADNNDGHVRRDRERGLPEYYDIEELLGVYQLPSRIVIFAQGLRWCAARLDMDPSDLRAVVFVHEIGHWVSHRLPHPEAVEWPTRRYVSTVTEVHEGFAQLLTSWICQQAGPAMEAVFTKLNRKQSAPYRIYQQFVKEEPEKVLDSIVRMRQMDRPASLSDWQARIR